MLAALAHTGLSGRPVRNYRLSRLETSDRPVILHVRSPLGGVGFRHWVLYTGLDAAGRVMLYDPPRGRLTLSQAELLAIWDGRVIVPEEAGAGSDAEPLPAAWLARVAAAGLCVFAFSRTGALGRWLAVPLAACLCAAASQLVDETSLAKNPDALGLVRAAHFSQDAPMIDYDELQRLIRTGGIVVDTRFPDAFAAGHVGGAVNVPISSGFGELQAAVARWPKDAAIAFYCLNDRCGWSDTLANQFYQRGYRNVVVYRGGYMEWRDRQQSP